MAQIDWVLVLPLIVFIVFGFSYLLLNKKQTGESWFDIFFE